MNDERVLPHGWFDFRAWWRLRGRLVREPERSLEGRAGNGQSAVAFARFLWILLPTALVGVLAGAAALQPDRGDSAYEQTAALAMALREEALGMPPPPSRPEAPESAADRLAWSTAMTMLSFGQPMVSAGEREAAAVRVRDLLDSHHQTLSPAQFERRQRILANELLAAARKLRWFERLQESGLSNLLGFLFIGALLPVLATSFRWMVGRIAPTAPHAEQAGDVYLYAVVARLTPWYLLNILGTLLMQAGIAFQSPALVVAGSTVVVVVIIPLVVAHYRAGPMVARVLMGEEVDAVLGRRYAWRLVGVFAVTQLFAATWIACFTFGIEWLARRP